MTDLLHEQLSALIDGELPAAETALLMKRLEREPELRARLARYHVCGETMRGGRLARTSGNFSLRISAALEAEPSHASTRAPGGARARPRSRFLRPVAGLAVAAAVAGAAILVVGRPELAPVPPQTQAREATAPRAVDAGRTLPPLHLDVASVADSRPAGTEPASYTVPPAPRNLGVIPGRDLTTFALVHAASIRSIGAQGTGANLVTEDDDGAPARNTGGTDAR